MPHSWEIPIAIATNVDRPPASPNHLKSDRPPTISVGTRHCRVLTRNLPVTALGDRP
ncbi:MULTISPECIES: hypothetical protein [unclassified Microcoleus]|uniref:hypothetical protein n=1 Tax=unclassified Microcoleus TaxID=2642155 RepID=UPI002FD551CE